MSLYNDASLVMIPSAYKDGKLYSIKPTDGSGDFTFSRGSNLAATRVDENGLIEKGRENLLLQSNQFDTTWVTSNTSVTSGQAGYDGSNDAWLLSKSAASGRIYQNITGIGIVTSSIYFKANASNWGLLQLDSTPDAYVYVDLINGVSGSTGSGNIDATITSVGGGWYRVSVTANSTTRIRIYPAEANGDVSGTSGSIYIQDAQLEAGLVATDYIETTTTTAQAGILEDMPRLDYSGGASCPSLLLEPTRTNSVVHSEYYGTWLKNGVVVEQNQIISPDGSLNGSKFQGDGTNSPKMLYTGAGSVTSGTTYTWSAFVKKGTLNFCQLLIGSATFDAALFSNFDLLNGTIGSNGGGAIPFIESYGNDWYRVGITATANANGTATPFIVLANSATMGRVNGFATSDYIYIYGANYESGSYPTSYIPCYGAATTRSEDSCTNADVSSLLGNGVGTAFIDVVVNGEDTQGNIPLTIGTGTANLVYLWIQKPSRTIRYEVYISGALQGGISTSAGFYTYGDRIKVALVWADDDFVMYINGTLIGTDTSGTAPTPTKLWLGQYTSGNYKGASINQVSLFPTRLTNAELAALTTL